VNTLQLKGVCAAPWGQALLKDIAFTLQPGTVLGLAGPNGAGKSSLLQLIAGDIQPSTGQLTFCDRALTEWPPQERAQRLAFLPQMSLLSFPYTVEEVVRLGRIPHSSGYQGDSDIVEQALDLTDTASLRHRLYTQLSGGEKQRTQLARIFAQILGQESLSGSLLLLDEPTSALDLAHQQLVLMATHQLGLRGCALVVVIHDLNLMASIANQILVLDNGCQVAYGSPEQVFTTTLFKEVFGVDVTVGHHPQEGYPMITPLRPALR
jgi:iron complex transport system ATP-binding protein